MFKVQWDEPVHVDVQQRLHQDYIPDAEGKKQSSESKSSSTFTGTAHKLTESSGSSLSASSQSSINLENGGVICVEGFSEAEPIIRHDIRATLGPGKPPIRATLLCNPQNASTTAILVAIRKHCPGSKVLSGFPPKELKENEQMSLDKPAVLTVRN